MKKTLTIALFMFCGIARGINPDLLVDAQLQDFRTIHRNLEAYHPSHWAQYEKVASETLRKDALILASDHTPVDVILRRTQALIDHLGLQAESDALDAFKKRNRSDLSEQEQQNLFLEIAAVRRRVTFANPLLDFDSMFFLKHNRIARGDSHMVDQYLGVNQARGGGVYRLDRPFSETLEVKDLLTNSKVQSGRLKGKALTFDSGSFISLDLDFDAQ